MKVSTYFNLQRKHADGSIPISVCVSRPPVRFYISTGLTSTTVFEDAIFPRSEKNHKAKTIRLNQIIDGIEEILISNSLLPEKELKQKIKERVFGEVNEIKPKMLWEHIRDFRDTKNGSTYEKYDQTYKKVYEFDRNATLGIDYRWLERFDTELCRTLADNTVSIHLRNIRAVINWCIKNDLTDNYPFRKFRIRHGATRKRNLTIEQIRSLKDMPLTDHHAKYRDIFMLTFYLIGINSKDLLLARPEQLIGDRLDYNRYKTKKNYSIKVEPEAMEIIERYRGKDYLLKFCDTAEYKNVRTKTNLYVGELMENVTTYYARHSWATIAYSLGIPKDIISQALGHSMGCETTEIYIERDTRQVDSANRKVIDALFKI